MAVARVVGLIVALSIILLGALWLFKPQSLLNVFALTDRQLVPLLRSQGRALSDAYAIETGELLRNSLEGLYDVPELYIDVSFKNIRKIYKKREEALERGILVQADGDFVKGTVRYDGRSLPVKLRLKGDWNDHLVGRKWSFRIHVRDGEQLFGMRRFSIQNPGTRGYQAEILYFETLRRFGVMVPRYMFVDVNLNGDSMGLMALEEFFAKELLEFNQRREGVIIRYDESLVWDAKDAISGEENGWGGAFDHFTNAPLDAIGSSRIAESPALSEQLAVASGLLKGFTEQKLAASDVFDVRQLAGFIAVADMFGAWHSVRWHNLRFYLNPITMKLEPIPFDGNLQEPIEENESVSTHVAIVVAMLRDPEVWQAYKDALRELDMLIKSGELLSSLKQTQQLYLRTLRTEFRFLGNYPLNLLEPRLETLIARAREMPVAVPANDNFVLDYANERDEYPVLAHLGLLREAGDLTLRIESALPREVNVRTVEWVHAKAGNRVSAIHKEILPIDLPSRGVGEWGGYKTELKLAPPPQDNDWELRVAVGYADRDWVNEYRPQHVFPALTQRPIPSAKRPEQLAEYAFISVDAERKLLTLRSGNWRIDETLVIPAGFRLLAEPGTTLNFAADAVFISYSPLDFRGTADMPVRLLAADGESWPGMVVMDAGGRSNLKYTEVRDTRGVTIGSWNLTGGINFYASEVHLDSCRFFNSLGEDALNIIHSRFTIDGLLIDGTASDAFDADFSTGEVTGSRFVNVGLAGGGDAVDVSGSEISVLDSEFSDVSDKALSVGERSTMEAAGITVSSSGTGAASKDASVLRIKDSEISGVTFAALTAYIKKPEYGPAEIVADNVRISESETTVLAQTGSRIVVDGEEAESRDVNVDALYETIMRKGLRR
ncbi:MAG: CotH kinase family protein [Gammaproteobacteria bacterium]